MVGRKIKNLLGQQKPSKYGNSKAKRRLPKGEWGGGRSMIDWLKENDTLSFDYAKQLIERKKGGVITEQEVQWLRTYSLVIRLRKEYYGLRTSEKLDVKLQKSVKIKELLIQIEPYETEQNVVDPNFQGLFAKSKQIYGQTCNFDRLMADVK
ncbi:MAG: hypothetical protein ACI9S8_001233 [Chlamydiales bacterium]|jgi:hypothetical protein